MPNLKVLYLPSQSPVWKDSEWPDLEFEVTCGPIRVSEIPKWFDKGSTTENISSRAIKIYLKNWDLGSHGPKGCALLIVCKGGNHIFPEFVCEVGCDKPSPNTLVFCLPKISHVGPNGMWVHIEVPLDWLESCKRSYWVSIASVSENVEFECMAGRLLDLYGDAEFFREMSNISEGDLDPRCFYDSINSTRVAIFGPVQEEEKVSPTQRQDGDFDRRLVFTLCFRPRAACHLISDWSNGPSLTIDVPDNDSGRMGLLLCAHFTVPEDQKALFRPFWSSRPHHLRCVLGSNVAGTKPKVHLHGISTEELRLLWTPNGFHWLSYIPLALFGRWLNQRSCLEATFSSNYSGLIVKKCILRFFHVCSERELIHDSIPFFETLRLIGQLEAFLDEKTEDEDKEKPNSSNRSDEDSGLKRPRAPPDSRLEDEGKRKRIAE